MAVTENVLAARYAATKMRRNFSPVERIKKERRLWVAAMKAQNQLGAEMPSETIEKFERAINRVNQGTVKWIEGRELEIRHDVMAKIERFRKDAGAEGDRHGPHEGFTSRDLTDNVEQMQIRDGMGIIFGKGISLMRHFAGKCEAYDSIILTARSHHQAAQPTLLGRRFSMWTEEFLLQLAPFEAEISNYPLRGIKGPVGTQFDMLTLLGSAAKVEALEGMIAEFLGFSNVLSSPGQVYPRSLDLQVISRLVLLTAACENFANGMRLMAGYELVTEGFKKMQKGSSAMPHKMNTRSSERIWALAELMKMYADGASRLSGTQWEEGDVSCSAMRRIIIPDAFYCMDGLCETTLTVLNEMGAYPKMIGAEVDRYLPFLASTEMLMMAVKAGLGRENAHELIRKHSIAEALAMREEGKLPNLAEKLAGEASFRDAGITKERIDAVLAEREHFIGNARNQIRDVIGKAKPLLDEYKKEAKYEPEQIL